MITKRRTWKNRKWKELRGEQEKVLEWLLER
jgi:hypothetical protein